MDCPVPEGAIYIYPSCAGLIGRQRPDGIVLSDDRDIVRYLLEQTGIASVPGGAYRLPPFLRLDISVDAARLEEACERILSACQALGKPRPGSAIPHESR